MEEEAPLRFYGCGVNSFFQLGPLMTDALVGAAAAEEKDDATTTATTSLQDHHPPHHPQARGRALHLPQPLAFDRFLADEDGPVQDLACGSTFTVALTTRGVPYQWGTVNGKYVCNRRGACTVGVRQEENVQGKGRQGNGEEG